MTCAKKQTRTLCHAGPSTQRSPRLCQAPIRCEESVAPCTSWNPSGAWGQHHCPKRVRDNWHPTQQQRPLLQIEFEPYFVWGSIDGGGVSEVLSKTDQSTKVRVSTLYCQARHTHTHTLAKNTNGTKWSRCLFFLPHFIFIWNDCNSRQSQPSAARVVHVYRLISRCMQVDASCCGGTFGYACASTYYSTFELKYWWACNANATTYSS